MKIIKKEIPKVGERYIIEGISLDPWNFNEKHTIIVLDVCNGWVKYKSFYGAEEECLKISMFWGMYAPIE